MNVAERQYPLSAVIEVRFSDFVDDTGAAVTSMSVGSVPAGALITDMFLQVAEAFDASAVGAKVLTSPGASTDVGNVPAPGTGTSGVGRTAGQQLGQVANQKTDIVITRSATTDTTGKAYLVVEYLEPKRHNEVQD